MSIEPRKADPWRGETSVLPPRFVGDLVYWCRGDGTVTAASAEHGVVWEHELGLSTPPVGGAVRIDAIADVVLVAAGGTVRGLEPSTGEVRWAHEQTFGATQPLAWRHEMIDAGLTAQGNAPSVHAMNLRTGAERLLFEREALPKPVVVVADRLVALERKTCVALELTTGTEAWSTELARRSSHPPGHGGPVGEPAVESDCIIFPISGYGFVALDSASGSVVWERKLDAQPNHCMGVHEGVAHVLTATRYTALATATGAVLVSKSITKQTRPLGLIDVGLPAFFDGWLFAADVTGTVFAFDPKTLTIPWHDAVGARIPFACRPAVAHDKLWVTSLDGKLHVYDLAR